MEIATKISPIALALIMFGLGLGLKVADFLRVVKAPKDFFANVPEMQGTSAWSS